MIDTSRLPTRRIAALGVIGLALLIGVILLVRVSSLPAYEATAEFTVAIDDSTFDSVPPEDKPRPDLEEERMVFATPRIANDAASLSADPGDFVWYRPDLVDVALLPLDAHMILRSYQIETMPDADQIVVRFRADEPTVAWAGANLVVEAYLRFRPQVGSPIRLEPRSSTAPADRLEPIAVTSLSFAPIPTNRIDNPDPADVFWFVLVSALAVYFTWTWWPDPQRQPERSDPSGPVM